MAFGGPVEVLRAVLAATPLVALHPKGHRAAAQVVQLLAPAPERRADLHPAAPPVVVDNQAEEATTKFENYLYLSAGDERESRLRVATCVA